VLGTSLEVYPVAGLVPQAKSLGARLVIVNRDETPFDSIADLVIRSELQPVMAELRRALAL
jgi:NAD-dependent deacetylase